MKIEKYDHIVRSFIYFYQLSQVIEFLFYSLALISYICDLESENHFIISSYMFLFEENDLIEAINFGKKNSIVETVRIEKLKFNYYQLKK